MCGQTLIHIIVVIVIIIINRECNRWRVGRSIVKHFPLNMIGFTELTEVMVICTKSSQPKFQHKYSSKWSSGSDTDWRRCYCRLMAAGKRVFLKGVATGLCPVLWWMLLHLYS